MPVHWTSSHYRVRLIRPKKKRRDSSSRDATYTDVDSIILVVGVDKGLDVTGGGAEMLLPLTLVSVLVSVLVGVDDGGGGGGGGGVDEGGGGVVVEEGVDVGGVDEGVVVSVGVNVGVGDAMVRGWVTEEDEEEESAREDEEACWTAGREEAMAKRKESLDAQRLQSPCHLASR